MLTLTDEQYEFCENMIIQDEGFRSFPYKDTEGEWTIGFGSNMSNIMHMLPYFARRGITKIQALEWLHRDINNALTDIGRTLPWVNDLEPAQKIALINMCYNLGLEKLLGFKNFLHSLENLDIDLAIKELYNSKWATQVKTRADRISVLLKTKGKEYESLNFG